jgi:hypothetical protein
VLILALTGWFGWFWLAGWLLLLDSYVGWLVRLILVVSRSDLL